MCCSSPDEIALRLRLKIKKETRQEKPADTTTHSVSVKLLFLSFALQLPAVMFCAFFFFSPSLLVLAIHQSRVSFFSHHSPSFIVIQRPNRLGHLYIMWSWRGSQIEQSGPCTGIMCKMLSRDLTQTLVVFFCHFHPLI